MSTCIQIPSEGVFAVCDRGRRASSQKVFGSVGNTTYMAVNRIYAGQIHSHFYSLNVVEEWKKGRTKQASEVVDNPTTTGPHKQFSCNHCHAPLTIPGTTRYSDDGRMSVHFNTR